MSHIINNKNVDITTSSAFIIVFPFLIRRISLAIYFHCCRFSGAKWIGIYWRALGSKTKHSPAQSKLEQLNYRIGEFNFQMLILFDFGFNFNGTQDSIQIDFELCALLSWASDKNQRTNAMM